MNRRDAKGWTPLSVAIFHDQKKRAAAASRKPGARRPHTRAPSPLIHPRLARLLLDHGADPNLANQFGHTAFDVAKDTLASDERTVLKDKAEVRAVLEEWDREHRSKLFGNAGGVKIDDGTTMEQDLPKDGTAVALQVEMAKDDDAAARATGDAPKKGGAKKKGGAGKKAASAAARLSVKKGKKKS